MKSSTKSSRLHASHRNVVQTSCSTVSFRLTPPSFHRWVQARLQEAQWQEKPTHWYSHASRLVTSLTNSCSVSQAPKQWVRCSKAWQNLATTSAVAAQSTMFTSWWQLHVTRLSHRKNKTTTRHLDWSEAEGRNLRRFLDFTTLRYVSLEMTALIND